MGHALEVTLVARRAKTYVRISARHWQQKLDDHDVELIRALRDEGLALKEIAEKFEVSTAQVSRICRYVARRRAFTNRAG
jgi:DNA-directed RNA polymerase specialized sigma subunit